MRPPEFRGGKGPALAFDKRCNWNAPAARINPLWYRHSCLRPHFINTNIYIYINTFHRQPTIIIIILLLFLLSLSVIHSCLSSIHLISLFASLQLVDHLPLFVCYVPLSYVMSHFYSLTTLFAACLALLAQRSELPCQQPWRLPTCPPSPSSTTSPPPSLLPTSPTSSTSSPATTIVTIFFPQS